MRPTPSVHRVTGALALAGLAASLVSVSLTTAVLASRPTAPPADPCAIDTGALGARDRTFVVRRQLACADLAHGRITLAEYRQQIVAIDKEWTTPPAPPEPPAPPAPPAPVVTQWASTVIGFSSEYTPQDWSASRVLGEPDVFPGHGDSVNAWASLGADDRTEWLEVGYAQPTRISAVEVYETYNPGAVSAIELVTVSGKKIVAYRGAAKALGQTSRKLRADLACTDEPIANVRVTLASAKVPDWNEIDAIGVVPCAEQ